MFRRVLNLLKYLGGSMNLSEGNIHGKYCVISMDLAFQTHRRLQALGMTLDTEIEILHKKHNGTLAINLRGTRFALGKDISEHIEVVPCQKK